MGILSQYHKTPRPKNSSRSQDFIMEGYQIVKELTPNHLHLFQTMEEKIFKNSFYKDNSLIHQHQKTHDKQRKLQSNHLDEFRWKMLEKNEKRLKPSYITKTWDLSMTYRKGQYVLINYTDLQH